MYAYSNNGHSYRAWNDPDNLLDSEVYFDHKPTIAELQAAFSNYIITGKQIKITELNATYNDKLSNLATNYVQSVLSDGTTETTKKAVYIADKATLLVAKAAERSVILNG